ncbi:beta strand repeat-containing protein [Almyronema epifaneia]|uniref:Beta strand repeat-containing protein n=1 Tax=Almyronema epifaneia S1 TaxID=2991925 RepID=A0ABW6IIL1_9CYAN
MNSTQEASSRKTRLNRYTRLFLLLSLFTGGTLLGMLPALAGTLAGVEIRNTAVGSFEDPNNPGNLQQVTSNEVIVTVAEVAGITVTSTGTVEAASGVTGAGPSQGDGTFNPEDVVYFTYTLTNVGNDPTQFFIPDAPASISGGTQQGAIEIVAYDPDGANGATAATDLSGSPISVPSGGVSTGDAAALGLPNGSIPPGGTVTIRVPVKLNSTLNAGDTVTVVIGDTTPVGDQNQPYSDGGVNRDVYTQDNQNGDTVDIPATATVEQETANAPINGEREASASQDLTVGATAVAVSDYGDAPDSYGDASHTLPNTPTVYLGSTLPDGESDTQLGGDGGVGADGDDTDGTDDDDGVTRSGSDLQGQVFTAGSTVTLDIATTGSGNLSAWVDWNANGTFESGEAIALDITDGGANDADGTANNVIELSVNVPSNASLGETYARFRYGTDTGLGPTGAASAGEVEDYQITINSSTPIISGRIFEDINYGGGAGRNYTTANAAYSAADVGTQATIELRDSDGTNCGSNVISNPVTANATTGAFSFTGLYSGSLQPNTAYCIRVVNDTVKSNRPSNSTGQQIIPVQTFRTESPSGTGSLTAITNEVGGRFPADQDTPAYNFDATPGGQTTQSWSIVRMPATGGVSGIDFGFNFDTVVNTRTSGQGSLEQFIRNSNELDNTNLVQAGQTAGKEVSIFMIPTAQLTNGVAVIQPTANFSAITDDDTTIDGTTQTSNIGDSNAGSFGYIGPVGTGADNIEGTGDEPTLSGLNRPEVEIRGQNSRAIGLDLQGNNETIRGISIYGYGDSTGPLAGDIVVRGTGALIEDNLIGTPATSLSDPGAGTRSNAAHVYLNANSESTIQNNIIAYSGRRGIFSTESANVVTTITGNEILSNNRTLNYEGGGIEFTSFAGNFGVPAGTVTSPQGIISGNLITGHSAGIEGADCGLEFNGTTNASMTVIDNTFSDNWNGICGYTFKTPNPHDNAVTIQNNVIKENDGPGIGITRLRGFTITRNSIYDNGGLGIDLDAGANDGAYVSVQDGPGNDAIDYPVITSTTLSAGTLQVEGFVGSNPAGSPTFANTLLEFFIADNDPADQDGEVVVGDGLNVPHGEGRTYLGSCLADGNGLFSCSFSNAGTLGLTDPNNITATTTDSNNYTSQFGAIITPPVASNPALTLVKRLTAINGIPISSTVDDVYDNPATTAADESQFDNHPYWPAPLDGSTNISTYLAGDISRSDIQPGDELEYTIYFLSNGDAPLTNLNICDMVPTYTTYVPGSMTLQLGSDPSATSLSDTGLDTDAGEFFTSGNLPSIPCPNPTNDNGAVVFTLVEAPATLPNATSAGNPNNSYGYVRFRVQVDSTQLP